MENWTTENGQITGTNGQWKMDKSSRKNMENGQLKKAV